MPARPKYDEKVRLRLSSPVREALRIIATRDERTEAGQIRRYVTEGLRRDGLLPEEG